MGDAEQLGPRHAVDGGVVDLEVNRERARQDTLHLVQPLDHLRRPDGVLEVAVDTVRAGRGDLVFLVGSREAALALSPSFVPVDAAVVGIVDRVAV